MSVEYDLVIVGSTVVSQEAAIAAATRKARVALIDPTLKPAPSGWNAPPRLVTQALIEIVHKAHHARQMSQTGLVRPIAQPVSWPAAWDWARYTAEQVWQERSPTQMATCGVDVIAEAGEFVRRPRLAFMVGERLLRSRNFLLAPTWATGLPAIDGLDVLQPWTLETLWQSSTAPPLPQKLVVLGNGAIALELAQTFSRLGSEVTLIVEESRPLLWQDVETSVIIQAQLEAEGVTILSHTTVTQVRSLEGKKWVQAGSRALETDEILVANEAVPLLRGLNLEGAGVQQTADGLLVNSKLQTTNPRIYACGSTITRANSVAIAQAEVRTILRNTLFLPLYSFTEQAFPRLVATDPPLAQVGLIEEQTLKRPDPGIRTIKVPFKQLGIAQLRYETTGFCKLLINRRGNILGAQIVGSQAREMIELVALAMRSRRKIIDLEAISGGRASFAEVFHLAAIAWQEEELKSNRTWQDCLEGWFDFRRARAR